MVNFFDASAKTNGNEMKNLLDIFQLYPQVKLVYFFGSRAKGKDGPLSDYDFAVYLDEKVDFGILYDALQNRLVDIEEFIDAVKEKLNL